MSEHELRIERESEEAPDPDFKRSYVERRLTGYARTTCICGLDTGRVLSAEAQDAFHGHAALVGAST